VELPLLLRTGARAGGAPSGRRAHLALWHVAQSSKPWALLPSWQEPQLLPFSMSAWRITAGAAEEAVRLTMEKSFGWQVVQSGFEASTCAAWLKVTTPGLPSPCGSAMSFGRFGSAPA
jgi:hypothetical protein